MAAKYLSYFPKPVLDDFVSGRWLPIVGAGMSLNAEVPFPEKMPLWPDLAKRLAEELPEYSSNSVLDAISRISTSLVEHGLLSASSTFF